MIGGGVEGVPLVDEGDVEDEVFTHGPGPHAAPEGERPGELVAVRLGVEEVVDGGEALVANHRVEVPQLPLDDVVAGLEVELRDGEAVVFIAVPFLAAILVQFEPERLGEEEVVAVEHVGPATYPQQPSSGRLFSKIR